MRKKAHDGGHRDTGLGTARARTCGDERGVLLQLGTAESLLVVQDAGVKHGARTVAFFKCLSLW